MDINKEERTINYWKVDVKTNFKRNNFMEQLTKIDWEKMNNLIPVITQDATTNEVLMLAYMNQEALELTLKQIMLTILVETNKESGKKVKVQIIFNKLLKY